MAEKENKEEKFELLSSFHQQFAENQNHLQTVFIQFISAVLVVLVGYGFVYTNMTAQAKFADLVKEGSVLKSYDILDLFGSYLIAQTILGLLVTLTANIGYSFRRDQFVNFNIRHHYLDKKEYEAIFGIRSYDPRGKWLGNYLPEFNRMFIFAIYIIQLILFWSILTWLYSYGNFSFFGAHWCITFFIFFPQVWSVYVYLLYYHKYKYVCESNETA
jgi:hypothetical protein